ncbi:Pre-mRNA-processing factor 6 [Porphyridium purpureum]|uniref:Pre-mRNA-processing factor 6 n=1 Tax=Porphyridium purpureum TaxID=35688 RepID=A0A5J4Z920_PORPP|nr:Pre-mRNA-processing factor 6 [Porphyridium purpureum]|eukprot:POR5544..scf295_1
MFVLCLSDIVDVVSRIRTLTIQTHESPCCHRMSLVDPMEMHGSQNSGRRGERKDAFPEMAGRRVEGRPGPGPGPGPDLFGPPPPNYVPGAGRGLGDRRREENEATALRKAAAFRNAQGRRRADGAALKSAGRASTRAVGFVDDGHDNDDFDDDDVDEDDAGIGSTRASGIPGARALADDEGGLFADAVYEKDDEEADAIYGAVEQRLASRNRRNQERTETRRLQAYRSEREKLEGQFAPLKRHLSTMTEADWMAIPDEVASMARNKKLAKSVAERKGQSQERFTPVPDSVLAGRLDNTFGTTARSSLSPHELPRHAGLETGISFDSPAPSVSASRGLMLGQKLDAALGSSFADGAHSVDPANYLSQLSSEDGELRAVARVGDVKKARMLLRSVIATNPTHAPGWIAAARLEEHVGKNLKEARSLIARGCAACPKSDDIWLESARLHVASNDRQGARAVLAAAVLKVPKSVKIWLEAQNLEESVNRKRAILRRALELIPSAHELWRTLIDLETDRAGARALLRRAVESCPSAPDLWLALAKLQDQATARATLKRARGAIPSEPQIWLAAAQLEETQLQASSSKTDSDAVKQSIDGIIRRAVAHLTVEARLVDRGRWLEIVALSDASTYPLTCEALGRHALLGGVEGDHKAFIQLKSDVEYLEARNSIHAARCLLRLLLEMDVMQAGGGAAKNPEIISPPGATGSWNHARWSPWLIALDFERRVAALPGATGSEGFEALARTALRERKSDAELYLYLAQTKARDQDEEGARAVFEEGHLTLPHHEALWLAHADFEVERRRLEAARSVLRRACEVEESASLLMSVVRVVRSMGADGELERLLQHATERFPHDPRFWAMLAELFFSSSDSVQPQRENGLQAARDLFYRALDGPDSAQLLKQRRSYAPLWIKWSRLEETHGDLNRARALLERGLSLNRGCAELWLASARLEKRSQTKSLASAGGSSFTTALSKLWAGIRECKALHTSRGALWSELIECESAAQQKARSVDALKDCDDDGHVMLAVARLFWRQRKLDKARGWLERAVSTSPGFGDAWGAALALEREWVRVGGVANTPMDPSRSHANGASAVPPTFKHEQRATEDLAGALEAKCELSQPQYGELWHLVRDKPGHEALSTAECLRCVSQYFDAKDGAIHCHEL